MALSLESYVYPRGYPRTNKHESKKRLDELKKEVGQLQKGSIISFEPSIIYDRVAFYHLDAMLVAQELGLKTINGYTSTVPVGYYHYSTKLTTKTRKHWEEKKQLDEQVKVISDSRSSEIKTIIQKIKDGEEWFLKIKNSAIENNITVEQSLLENATWIYMQSKKKTK